MKNAVLVLVVLGALCVPLHQLSAAPDIASVEPSKPDFVQPDATSVEARVLPPELQKQVPPQGVSRFFCATSLQIDNQNVFIHIFETRKGNAKNHGLGLAGTSTKPVSGGKSVGQPQPIEIDFYVYRKASHRYRKIKSLLFSYPKGADASRESVNVSTLWLDAKTQHCPIIKIDFSTPGLWDAMGSNLLLIFPQGLRQASVIHEFRFGASNAGGGESWHYSFDKRDEKGNLMVSSYWGTPHGSSELTFVWNGRQFVPDEQPNRKN